MAITTNDLKVYESETMTDAANAGGRMSGNEVVSGSVNNVFPNISRVNRLTGKIELRKVFCQVISANADVYSGAHIINSALAADPSISFLIVPATAWGDERSDMVDYLETYWDVVGPSGGAGLAYAVAANDRQLVYALSDVTYTALYSSWGFRGYQITVVVSAQSEVMTGDTVVLVDYAPRANSTGYTLGQTVVPRAWNGHFYECTTAGTTASTEPSMGTSGGTTADGGAVWTDQGLVASTDYEFALVERAEIQTQGSRIQGRITSRAVVSLAGPLSNGYSAGRIPYSVEKNASWKAFGAMSLASAATAGDSEIQVDSTRIRLVPVVSQTRTMTDQAFFPATAVADDQTFGPTGATFELDGMPQPYVSESLAAVVGQLSYSKTLSYGPVVAGTMTVYCRKNAKWERLSDDGAGALSGAGAGAVDYGGFVSFTLRESLDAGTHIVIVFARTSNQTAVEGTIAGTAGALPRTLAFGQADLFPGSVRLSYDSAEGSWALKDDGEGTLEQDVGDAGYFEATVQSGTAVVSDMPNDAMHSGGNWYYASATKVAVSTNGKDYTQQSPTGSSITAIKGIASSGAVDVIVGGGGAYASYRSSGGAWTDTASSLAGALYAVRYGDGVFVAVGADGKIYTSANGQTWVARVNTLSGTLTTVCYSEDLEMWVVAGGTTMLAVSTDNGETWAQKTFSIGGTISKSAWSGTSFWIIGASKSYAKSSDGNTWTGGTLSIFTGGLLGISAAREFVVAVGYDNTSDSNPMCFYSIDDGANWTTYNIDKGGLGGGAPNDQQCYSVETDMAGAWAFVNGRTDGVYDMVIGLYSSVPLLPVGALGTVDYAAGTGTLSGGYAPTTAVTADYFLYERGFDALAIHTNGGDPVVANTMSITAEDLDGNELTVTENPSSPGTLTGDGSGTVNRSGGYALATFDDPVDPETVRVSYSFAGAYHPQFDDIDVNAFPLDGLVPVVQAGDILVIDDGTNEDMQVVEDVIDDRILFSGPLAHGYSAGALVSSAESEGDLQASMDVDFDQESWDGTTWSDVQAGNAAPDAYDWVNYPLTLTNQGADTERWAVEVVGLSPLAVDVIGENAGTVLEGFDTTLGDIAPENSQKSVPFFTMDADGWPEAGGSFEVGNIIRFNTVAPAVPKWLARVTNAQSSSVTSDQVDIEMRGDVA